MLLASVASAQQSATEVVISEPSGNGAFRSNFAGFVIQGASPLDNDDARRSARELLSMSQISLSLRGSKADHGLCQANAVEAMQLPDGQESFVLFRADAKDQGFAFDDISLDSNGEKGLIFFTLKKSGRELLGLWTGGHGDKVLTLCRSR
ncbi:hypothetical protein [Deinococcus yavapaiensis]|uniref:hypothetical protein n=1 Tax=Deinococcus yavapaiensis TaxID=309889 RepID=UPI000DA14A74|nr:hypothetical protein [Deinococcus yavapaiensis]